MSTSITDRATDRGEVVLPLQTPPDAPLASAPQAVDVLFCHDRDNTVRWQPGERLQHLFERRCERFSDDGEPNHLAVDSEEGCWSYAELNAYANRLARLLTSHGLGAGDRVALLFDKSMHSYAAMLAVLKVHAAYVPLDATFPPERISLIAADAEAGAILTSSHYRRLAEAAAVTVICLDTSSDQVGEYPAGPLSETETGKPVDELCYIIYTSGTTGRPKGVPIEHASACNFVRVAAEEYGYRSDDRVYQGLTIAFDFAVEEIWVPLIVGATLLPNQSGSSLLGDDLADFLRKRGATALCCVPTLLATLESDLPNLRLLIVSGEACPGDLIARWQTPQRTLLNAYGPTEATVTATISRPLPGQPVTIGRPLPTYSIIILDPESEQALPFGEVGEIGIAGVGVAGGYLNRVEQTRRAFIPDFIGIPNNPSGLIYRTGDLGKVNGQGELEYLGRIDTQVKIRGYRIELAEIESVILRLPPVAQAVVDTWEPEPGIKDLVAYYTLRPDADALPAEQLVDDLRNQLPSYMVPAYYVQLDAMPMLASDKADRNALPPPDGARLNSAGREYIEPANQREADIAGRLAHLLKLEKVSVEDDFFDDLGGNSLLMAQFGARLRRDLGITDLSMRELYQYPSVRRLAATLAERGVETARLRDETPVHIASDWQYGLCGAMQLVLAFGWIYLNAWLLWEGLQWVFDATDSTAAYWRSTAMTAAILALGVSLPAMLKWLLIGRWQVEEFPVWSMRYLRFWVVRQLQRANPMVLFAGTPLFTLYLKLLGAHVNWRAVILSPNVPVCTDLVAVGANAIVSKNVNYPGYRVQGGRIRTGGIRIGRDAYVGEAAVLDIDTVMEAGSELAHASSLQRGQHLSAGQRYHGSPARPTEERVCRRIDGTASPTRMVLFSVIQLAALLLVYLPVPIWIAYSVAGPDASPQVSAGATTIVSWTSMIYIGSIIVGLVMVVTLPRLLNLFLRPDHDYPLYGFHYFIHRSIERLSNVKFYNELFGDSSYIVHYLRAIGYRFLGMVQTGSNFGMAQRHENPFLCEIGKGSMVSDGLLMLNAEISTASFRLSRVRIGAQSFLGNAIAFPPGAVTGDNCLFGTKVMVPIDGTLRENVGLLGSPSFEIPRSVRRDTRFDLYKRPDILRQRLRGKNLSNTVTMLLFLLAYTTAANISILTWHYAYPVFCNYGALYLTIYAVAMLAVLSPFFILIDRASLSFRRLQPRYCSIYDDYFWDHERHWKLGMSNDQMLLGMLNGTPFKGLAWRALGVKVGKKLFDDGAAISEKTLVSLGDHCTLNDHCTLQSHSLEDGTFKSDHITIGDGCTIAANCYVHYGVQMENGVTLDPDSFLMKGEHAESQSIWQGNPAREMHR